MENVPSVNPDSLWDSFKAGNLKKIKMYIDPSKILAVTPRTRSRLSGCCQYLPSSVPRKLTFNEQTQRIFRGCAVAFDIPNRTLVRLVSKVLRLIQHQMCV